MKIEDVIALAHAGFTAAQIMTLANAPAAQVQTQPAAQVQTQPVAQVQTQPAAQVQTQPVAQPYVNYNPAIPYGYFQPVAQVQTQPAQNDPIMEQLKALTGAVQSANINRSAQPATRSADDVVAAIINPPAKEA